MKKLMTSAIILLPLLILAIMLVSGAIMSLVTHIFVESVEFVEKSALVLEMDDETAPPTEQLLVNILPLKAENRKLVYTVEDESVISVDENGMVTAKDFGETYITVTSLENSAATAKRKVIVTDDNVHSVVLGEHDRELYRGDDPFRLSVQVLPEGATDKRVTWSTSDPDVLSVTQSGEVRCLGKGTATVTVTSVENPEIEATMEFTCKIPLQNVSAETTPVETAKKEAQFPQIVPSPADASYTVQYTSSDRSVATVDETGAIVFWRAGPVTITATAEDGRGNTDSVSVKYDCTYGYYLGRLFDKTEYTFDYDDRVGEALSELAFRSDLDDCYRQIDSVKLKGPDLIGYDEETKTFTLKNVGDAVALGTVEITVNATKYDKATGDVKSFDVDVCNVTVTRETESLHFIGKDQEISALSVTSKTINLFEVKEASAQGGIGVLPSPANHTDALSFSLQSDCADLAGETLTFRSEGKATVTVTAGSGASAQLEIEYTALKAADKTVELGEGQSEKSIALSFEDEDNCAKGILEFAAPAGYIAVIRSDHDDIVSVEEKKLVPHKGGFADITVTFLPDGPSARAGGVSGAFDPYTVHVYVDKTMDASDLTFSVGETAVRSGSAFVTSKNSATLTVRVIAKSGALAGKEVYLGGDLRLNGDDAEPQEGEVYALEEEISFDGAQTVPVNVSVSYGARATACDGEKTGAIITGSCELRSTDGKIESGLTVRLNGQLYGDGNDTLAFGDIGETVTLTIDASDPQPADFVLREEDISFYVNDFFDAQVTVEENVATVTLTSKNGSYGANDGATLTVAGKTFSFKVKSEVLADTLKVEAEHRELAQGSAYQTLLPRLTFTVTPSRTGRELTAAGKAVRYSYGTESGNAQANAGSRNFTFTVSPSAEETELKIESGTATVTVRLQKKALSELGFEVKLLYSDNGGEVPLGPFSFAEERVEAVFPKDIHGSFDIAIAATTDSSSFLGGLYEEDAKEYFALDEKQGWETSFGVAGMTAKYTVTPPVELVSFAGETLTLHGGGSALTFSLSRVDLQSVEFVGFDSGDDSNGGDVYKGYQQVRVFAKHSDYAEGGASAPVDYFRMPINALSNLVHPAAADVNSIAWTLTRFNDRTGEQQTLVTQLGTTLTYKAEGSDVEYTIVPAEQGPSTLQRKQDGKVIAQGGKYAADIEERERIPWVDVFAEQAAISGEGEANKQGYAHLYFGNFGGLSEVDVQNDYFGNFGEKAGWTKVEQTVMDADAEGSGRNFTPSENAYTYLRVAAGDGSGHSKANAHFNFNVLEDDTLFNVFNAAGYYAHSNIVLQNDLYGPGELDGDPKAAEATEKGLFLNNKDGLGRTLIYGNGYQVNLEAKTASMGQYSESDGIAIERAYNTVIKCANPNDVISNKNQKMVFKMTYAYYCDLSYYYKFNPSNKIFYTKNTVFSCIPKAAVQLYYNDNALYAENIVMTECGTAIQADNASQQTIKIYYKGSVDILNYFNQPALSNMNDLVGSMFEEVVPGVKDYFEWHGKNVSAIAFKGQPGVDKIYVNVLAFAASDLSGKTYIWTDGGYKTLAEGGGTLNSGSKIANRNLAFSYYALTYEMMNDEGNARLDNAISDYNKNSLQFTGTADLNSLFSTNRYVRLQCEFKKPGVKNYDHILWHEQNAYRDQTLIKGRKSHIDDLKESLKNTAWDDGSGVDGNGDPYEPAAQLTAMISQTVVPGKNSYAD